MESSITISETTFSLICDVYSTGITYDDHNMFIVLDSYHRYLKNIDCSSFVMCLLLAPHLPRGGVKTERVFPGLSVLRKNKKMEV